MINDHFSALSPSAGGRADVCCSTFHRSSKADVEMQMARAEITDDAPSSAVARHPHSPFGRGKLLLIPRQPNLMQRACPNRLQGSVNSSYFAARALALRAGLQTERLV